MLLCIPYCSTGFIEDIDRYKEPDYLDMVKIFIDELIGLEEFTDPRDRVGDCIFATCEGDYLPWQFEDYGNELTGIYRIS